MKIKLFLLVIANIFITCLAISQDTIYNKRDSLGRWQGVWQHRDIKTNMLSSLCTYKDGKRYGLCIDYYKKGSVQSENYYINDTIHGQRKVYLEDGTLRYEETYNMGILHGFWKFYDFSGRIEEEQEYKDGIMTGIYRRYYKSGKINSETTIIDDIEQGIRKIFADTEQNELIREFEFVNGVKVKSRFYKDGKIVKEENF